jgi:hypothetical protein
MVITNVVPNPRRPNTRANAVYAKMEAWFHKNYKNAKVVTLLEDIDDYTPIDFDWDLTRGFVTVRNAKK